MISAAVFALLILGLGSQDPEPDARPLQRSVNTEGYDRCSRDLVGFRNVPMQCAVSADGSLRQCELLTTNRAVLRYRSRFECMASMITVTYPDGSPAVGRSVRTNLNLQTMFTRPNAQDGSSSER